MATVAVLVTVATVVVLVAAAPAAAQRRDLEPPVHVVLTTADLSHTLTRMPDRRFRPSWKSPTVPVIDVDDGVRYQRIGAFGAAMTDTSAWLIHDELSPRARAALLAKLFTLSGIGLGYLRLPIGASDFTALGQPYTYDDVPPGSADPHLRRFSIAHDEAYILPTLRQVMQLNPTLQILATPWSPPAWMKTNDALNNTFGQGALLPSAYQPLAAYFVRFIKAYARHGVHVAAVTPQNEPLSRTLYAGLNLSEPEEARLVRSFLAPAFRAAHLGTAIYGLDRGADLAYARALLGGAARRTLAGIAWHCYGGMQVMSALHELHRSVDQVVSECAPGIIPYPPAEVAISALRNWATSVALWNVALDPSGGPVEAPNSACAGCTGVVTISERTHTTTRGLNYYQLGQVSKFVRPGAVRIASTRLVSDFRTPGGAYGVSRGLDDVAVVNPDGRRVLVVHNGSSARTPFAVRWHWRIFTYALPSRATATFIWRPAPAGP